jgi:flavin reductase (DIM6/NTAB) family NADH-FMN oxidoreductase RutF/2-polyprenyl-6-methoxyphenol hydroxylase-like FAD-dependent oxidoreductase
VRRIAIIGAGQAGTQLALGLLDAGYEVTLVSNRTADEIRVGRVMSSQCMFATALESERVQGLDHWEAECPAVDVIAFAMAGESGKEIAWAARLDAPAQSVDQRIKVPAFMDEFKRRGGRLVVKQAGPADLEAAAASHDLVVVATGKGDLGTTFARDAEKSPYAEPQRALALTYVRGMTPREDHSAVCFNLAPGVGEYFVFPALTTTGACEIMVFEGLPGGPMDRFRGLETPEQHLETSLAILERYLPWEAERCRGVELTDDNGVLAGRYAPTVRRPVAQLRSGAPILGMADAVVLNDPITGQGSNNAAKCAEIYLESILERGDGPFDEAWMQRTFDRYWLGYAQWVVWWTNAMLAAPRPHVLELLRSAQEIDGVAAALANGFDDPRTFYPWFFEAEEAGRFIAAKRAQEAGRFDRRDLRRALGQFATGVTVVTTRTEDGRRVGITANSFTSLSLDPPLVLFALDRAAASLPDFERCEHFAVNVLAAHQHHLSRQFSTPAEDKFAGVECCPDGSCGVPLIEDALARFVCRGVERHDGGDHVIIVGEVERYETFEGEPLVFHSGSYRVATRHPEFA